MGPYFKMAASITDKGASLANHLYLSQTAKKKWNALQQQILYTDILYMIYTFKHKLLGILFAMYIQVYLITFQHETIKKDLEL